MNILAFSAKRNTYNSQVENDRAAGICLRLVKQSLVHENRLLYVVIVFYPIRNEGTATVHDLRILPLLPKTIEQAMMLHQLLYMKQPISKDPMEFPVIHIPLPKRRMKCKMMNFKSNEINDLSFQVPEAVMQRTVKVMARE